MFPDVKGFPDAVQYPFLQMSEIYKMSMWMPFCKEIKGFLNIVSFTKNLLACTNEINFTSMKDFLSSVLRLM